MLNLSHSIDRSSIFNFFSLLLLCVYLNNRDEKKKFKALQREVEKMAALMKEDEDDSDKSDADDAENDAEAEEKDDEEPEDSESEESESEAEAESDSESEAEVSE